MSRTYSIYEAKAKLSELLRLVKEGGEVVITERGKPIATVLPFQEKPKKGLAARLEELERAGSITKAKNPDALLNFKGVSRPGGLQRFLDERE